VAVLVLGAGWLSWRSFLAPPHPTAAPSTSPDPSREGPRTDPSQLAAFTIAHFREDGEWADIDVYSQPSGNICVRLPSQGVLSCDFTPGPDETIRLGYANWVFRDEPHTRLGVFVIGTIGPDVATVRVSTAKGRWVDATIVALPSEFLLPFRLFYMEKRTGFGILNRRRPIVALDERGREIGRTSYLVFGG
jgi:hypothetical protein